MKDSPVAGLNYRINRGRILFVEGKDLRTPEAGIEWQGRANQFTEEVKAWVKEQSPDDADRLETLSPYPPVGLSPDHPWWKPTSALGIASCTSSVLCEENHPVSYHLALVKELKEIVSDWRIKTPEPPIAAAPRKRRVHDKKLKERGNDWWREYRDWKKNHPGGDGRDFIEEIAAREDLSFAHIEREIRRARTGK